ncbi:Uncharacterised protein [Serratia ficaria]|uniref:Uncharacterized protein n=1 Tax=Serratia ficaria TaxID=61651 RepID=A0A240C525_SERFI|nr:hypothetical protein C7332_2443 [Serratia ficaria]CAI0776250.1 Uncharacterised protein [Serratia ficaria]CAI1916538.1 Uncharacterised protein [Serratia ficaria]CAI2027821.1 Uncharacterised protein [Serratia ficaria]CAI2445868.1 Uncharacterised protein [Serratia ficaria]
MANITDRHNELTPVRFKEYNFNQTYLSVIEIFQLNQLD